jgi:malate/lactate dehydrogenase
VASRREGETVPDADDRPTSERDGLRGASVGIFGAAGMVGSAAAFALALAGVRRLVLADAARARLTAQRTDLGALAAVLPGLDVASGGTGALADCDVVVACAGARHRDGAPRAAFLRENLAILAPLADALAEAAEDSGRRRRLLLVSNPVDALATLLQRRLGERACVVGHTLNDTLRLRVAIARRRGCSPADVEAWSVGEHGPRAVPLLSRVRVRGVPVALSAHDRACVLDDVGGWYERWQRLGTGRTTQWCSGWGVAAVVRAWLEGDTRPWPVSTALEGAWDVESDVCLTAPALLLPNRRPQVLAWQVAPEERAAIGAAAGAVADVCGHPVLAATDGSAP